MVDFVYVTQTGSEVWVVNVGTARVTQTGAEVWVSSPGAGRVTQIGLEVWRSVAVAGSIFPAPRKHTRGVFFKRLTARRPLDKRRRAVFLGNVVALRAGISKSTRFARFFVHKPARRVRNIRLHAPVLLYAVVSSQRRLGLKARFFKKRSNFRFGGRHGRSIVSTSRGGSTYVALVT